MARGRIDPIVRRIVYQPRSFHDHQSEQPQILAGMAEVLGISDAFVAFTVAIDKLDKVGVEGVLKEMRAQELPESAVITFGHGLKKD